MLTLTAIRENKADIIEAMKVRGLDADALIGEAIALDDKRKNIQSELDAILNKSNELSKQIGDLFKSGQTEEANKLKAETGSLKEDSSALKESQNKIIEDLNKVLFTIPNIPHPSVPEGKTDEDNEIIRTWGDPAELPDSAIPHWELASKYDLFDLELGVKLTGAGFPVYKNKGARFQRGLIQFYLDSAVKAGYTEMQVPIMVNEASGRGTGNLPDKEGQMYHVTGDDLYLIPTAEVPLTNIYRDVILNESDFPIKMCGYTPCFRREAGSYGKHVRGLNRLHQFDKVEIVQIQHPEKSYETLDNMVAYVETLLQALELPYRVAKLCGGDLSFTSALTFDMEVYSAAQKRWLEVSSISNFETFQSNRLKLRYKDANKKKHLAHTLNGSALALPRIVAALLENNQTDKGIKVPEVLRPYTGFEFID